MNQIFWEKEWLLFLQKYVRPLQEKAFTGYFHDVRCKNVQHIHICVSKCDLSVDITYNVGGIVWAQP